MDAITGSVGEDVSPPRVPVTPTTVVAPLGPTTAVTPLDATVPLTAVEELTTLAPVAGDVITPVLGNPLTVGEEIMMIGPEVPVLLEGAVVPATVPADGPVAMTVGVFGEALTTPLLGLDVGGTEVPGLVVDET